MTSAYRIVCSGLYVYIYLCMFESLNYEFEYVIVCSGLHCMSLCLPMQVWGMRMYTCQCVIACLPMSTCAGVRVWGVHTWWYAVACVPICTSVVITWRWCSVRLACFEVNFMRCSLQQRVVSELHWILMASIVYRYLQLWTHYCHWAWNCIALFVPPVQYAVAVRVLETDVFKPRNWTAVYFVKLVQFTLHKIVIIVAKMTHVSVELCCIHVDLHFGVSSFWNTVYIVISWVCAGGRFYLDLGADIVTSGADQGFWNGGGIGRAPRV